MDVALALWSESPLYFTVSVYRPTLPGVNFTEQLDTSLFSVMWQTVDEKLPFRLLEKVAVPDGFISVPGLVSATVTMHVVGFPTLNGAVHAKAVETLRLPTVSMKLAELPKWTLSPT